MQEGLHTHCQMTTNAQFLRIFRARKLSIQILDTLKNLNKTRSCKRHRRKRNAKHLLCKLIGQYIASPKMIDAMYIYCAISRYIAYNDVFSCIFLEARLWEQLYSVSVFAWAHWETQGRLPAARRCALCLYGKGYDCWHILHVDNVWDLWVYVQLQKFTINVLISIILRP